MREETDLLWLHAARGNYFTPAPGLGPHVSVELLGRAPDESHPLRYEICPERLVAECPVQFAVHPIHDVARHLGWPYKRIPGISFPTRETSLDHRRCIGRLRHSLCACDSKKAQLALGDMRHPCGDGIEHHGHMAATDVGQCEGIPFVGNVDDVNLRHVLEQLSR